MVLSFGGPFLALILLSEEEMGKNTGNPYFDVSLRVLRDLAGRGWLGKGQC